MAEALAGVRPEATAATPVVEVAAAQARKGLVGCHGAAKRTERRRSASQRSSGARGKLEASRGPFGPLTPTRGRTEDLLYMFKAHAGGSG